MNRVRGGALAAGLLTLMMVGVTAFPAAASSGSRTTDVSCDSTIIKDDIVVTHSAVGTMSIKQTATSPFSISFVTYRSTFSGNQLAWKSVSNGGTASWTSVLPASYQVRAHRDATTDCNGILFGEGNYSWSYNWSA